MACCQAEAIWPIRRPSRTDTVDYGWIGPFHNQKLASPGIISADAKIRSLRRDFERFVSENRFWLEDFALFAP